MEELYLLMVQLRESVKLLHFQTTDYSVHKITDDYLVKYDELFDTFWEVMQSDKFRVNFKANQSLDIINIRSYDMLQPILDQVLNKLYKITGPAKVSAETLIEETHIFKYLLSFK